MSKYMKVSVSIIDSIHDFEWMGKLTEDQLDLLCQMATGLSDLNDYTEVEE